MNLKSYRCVYTLDPLIDNGPLNPFIQLTARDAEEAARLARHITGCACVLEVVRLEG